MASSDCENKVKTWLDVVFERKHFKDISIKSVGNSEKGDGYLSDIFFVEASGMHEDGSTDDYDLVLKCNKRSVVLKQDQRFQESFVNEIFVYDKLLPTLKQFQKEKGIEEGFNNVSKCYGTLTEGDTQIIVLENLKKTGFDLWPRIEPLTRNHIELVIEAYAKLHATSAVLEIQQPDKFKQIVKTLESNIKSFFELGNEVNSVFKSCIEYAADVLKDDMDEQILLKWRNLGLNVQSKLSEVRNYQGFKTISHGDCWSNNFMFKYENNGKPSDVVILDWQVAKYNFPVADLSYFLLVCISKEDIGNLDDILGFYHKCFVTHLKKLGISDPNSVYSLDQLTKDWDQYCILGVMIASMLVKVCLADKNDIVDTTKDSERNDTFGSAFVDKIRNTDAFKNRIKHVIEYADKKNLL